LDRGEVGLEMRAQLRQRTVSAEPSTSAIEDARTQAASTIRRRRGATSRPNSRGQGWAEIAPRQHGSTNGCAIRKSYVKWAELGEV
jgi:hypothetical protein